MPSPCDAGGGTPPGRVDLPDSMVATVVTPRDAESRRDDGVQCMSPPTRVLTSRAMSKAGRRTDVMSHEASPTHSLIMLGWREWVSLPGLGVRRIKCKVDTGARTSALHATDIEVFHTHGRRRVRFRVHPWQTREDGIVHCEATVVDERWVSDSGGHRERRLVVVTPVRIGSIEMPIELTLTRRDTMRFRMLLGRSALSRDFAVRPCSSYLTGRPTRRVRRA